MLSTAVIKQSDPKQFRQERVSLVSHNLPLRDIRAETEAETKEEWLALQGLLRLLSYTQDHLLRSGTTHSELGPPISIINQENVPQTCLQTSLTETFSQWRFPLLT